MVDVEHEFALDDIFLRRYAFSVLYNGFSVLVVDKICDVGTFPLDNLLAVFLRRYEDEFYLSL